jgi:hypothetical protein
VVKIKALNHKVSQSKAQSNTKVKTAKQSFFNNNKGFPFPPSGKMKGGKIKE